MDFPTLSYLDGLWPLDEGVLADSRRHGSRLRASGMSRGLPLASLDQLLRPEGALLPPAGALLELAHYLHLSGPSMVTGRQVVAQVKDAVLAERFLLLRAARVGDFESVGKESLPSGREVQAATEPRGTYSIRLDVADLNAWEGTKVRLVGDDGRDWRWTVLEPHPNAINDATFVFTDLKTNGRYSLEIVEPEHTPRWLFRDIPYGELPNAEHHQRLPDEM